MPLKSFLGRLRKHAPDLPSLKIIGGPVSIQERVQLPFMPDQASMPRMIELRKSEDNKVFAVVWYVGKQSFSEIFTEELQAQTFYNEEMLRLRGAAEQEATAIKVTLQQQYDESWKDAKTVYFHKGFRVHIGFSETEQPVKINSQFLGLVRGPCPYCKVVEDFDARENFQRFLKNLDNVLDSDERLMPSHGGKFGEVGLPVRSRCSNCLSFPNVAFEAQSGKGLLRKLKERGGESGE